MEALLKDSHSRMVDTWGGADTAIVANRKTADRAHERILNLEFRLSHEVENLKDMMTALAITVGIEILVLIATIVWVARR